MPRLWARETVKPHKTEITGTQNTPFSDKLLGTSEPWALLGDLTVCIENVILGVPRSSGS